MKKQKALKYIEIALVLLTVLFVILKNHHAIFEYCYVTFLSLALIGGIMLCIVALNNTKKELEKEYDLYLVEKYNAGQITKQQLEQKDKALFGEYMKENRWEILRYYVFIAICSVVLFITIVSIFV